MSLLRRIPFHTQMLLGLLVGGGGGLLAHALAAGNATIEALVRNGVQPAGQIFLRLLFLLVIPLILSALALGVGGLGDLRSLGRIGLRTLVYTLVVSTIAVLLGVTLVRVLRPGDGISVETRARLLAAASGRVAAMPTATSPKGGIDLLVQIVPDNPVKAAATGDLIGFMFFSLLLGVGLVLTKTEAARRLQEGLQGLYDVTMTLIGGVIRLAPVGVACLLFTMTWSMGWEIVAPLARYVGVVVLALAIHQFVVFGLAVRLLGRRNPIAFFRDVEEAMLTAFATASSNATLPTALRVAEERLKLPPAVSRFVLTVGATANQNGTALFEGVTVLFLAQVYGVDLTFGQQALVTGIAILAGVGTAGIPAASMPVIAMILAQVGVPVEGIGLVFGVDRFLDMCRTTVNVTGDLAAAVVVSRGEPGAGEETAISEG